MHPEHYNTPLSSQQTARLNIKPFLENLHKGQNVELTAIHHSKHFHSIGKYFYFSKFGFAKTFSRKTQRVEIYNSQEYKMFQGRALRLLGVFLL